MLVVTRLWVDDDSDILTFFVFQSGMTAAGEAGPRFEPQVAMVCAGRNQYHAQYMTPTGRWVTDANSKVTCLKDKVDILRYCKQVSDMFDLLFRLLFLNFFFFFSV